MFVDGVIIMVSSFCRHTIGRHIFEMLLCLDYPPFLDGLYDERENGCFSNSLRSSSHRTMFSMVDGSSTVISQPRRVTFDNGIYRNALSTHLVLSQPRRVTFDNGFYRNTLSAHLVLNLVLI